MNPNIRHWHIIFGGFLQDQGNPTVGTVGTWHKLHSEVSDKETVVEWHPWCSCTTQLTERIRRFSCHDRDLTIITVYAYSWGATAARNLCESLKRVNLRVETVILTDGVYRHHYKLGWWRAAFSSSFLLFPDNVKTVHYQVQSNPRFSLSRKLKQLGDFFEPSGHRVHAADPRKTLIIQHPVTTLSHTHMDEASLFRDSVDKEIRKHRERIYG